ncbi:MAG: hypothetical protein R3A79_12645 [Nannocystaceae bacterium]
MHPAIRCLTVAAVLLLPAAARADAAPPADWVDPCKSVALDDSCQRCSAPEFKDRGCHERARAAGQEARCRGWNYTMYCGGAPQPTIEAPETLAPAQDPAPPAEAPPREAPPPASEAAEAPASAAVPPASAPEGSAPEAAQGGRCTLGDGRPAPAGALVLLLALLRRRRPAPPC